MALISARAFSYASTIPVIFSSTSFVDTKRNKLYVGKTQTLIICSSKLKLFAEIHEINEKNTNMNSLYLPCVNADPLIA